MDAVLDGCETHSPPAMRDATALTPMRRFRMRASMTWKAWWAVKKKQQVLIIVHALNATANHGETRHFLAILPTRPFRIVRCIEWPFIISGQWWLLVCIGGEACVSNPSINDSFSWKRRVGMFVSFYKVTPSIAPWHHGWQRRPASSLLDVFWGTFNADVRYADSVPGHALCQQRPLSLGTWWNIHSLGAGRTIRNPGVVLLIVVLAQAWNEQAGKCLIALFDLD